MVYTGIQLHTQNWQCLMGNNDKYLWNRRNEGINIHCEHQLFGCSSGCFFCDSPLRLCMRVVWWAHLVLNMRGMTCQVRNRRRSSWEDLQLAFQSQTLALVLAKKWHTHTHIPHPEATSSQTKCQNHAKTQVILHGLLRPQAELRAKICQKKTTTHGGYPLVI